MNRAIPHSSPRWTFLVCIPDMEASRVMSRHQQIILSDIRSVGTGRVSTIFE